MLNTVERIIVEACCKCGMSFGLTESFRDDRLEDGKTFYCPNGHGQHYTESKLEKLRRRAERAEARAMHERDQRIATEHTLRATKGHLTKAKKKIDRVTKGVCPECNRTFENLARHMETKHPHA